MKRSDASIAAVKEATESTRGSRMAHLHRSYLHTTSRRRRWGDIFHDILSATIRGVGMLGAWSPHTTDFERHPESGRGFFNSTHFIRLPVKPQSKPETTSDGQNTALPPLTPLLQTDLLVPQRIQYGALRVNGRDRKSVV